jgi:cytosine/adenosine deaminase-related metal-dependent hydrolase
MINVPDGAISLFKSARRALYRQQNLQLLAAERGMIMELAWNRAWVAAEYSEAGSIERGAPVVFVLTDRPYALFVPIRAGEVVEARHDDVSVGLRVALGSSVRPV